MDVRGRKMSGELRPLVDSISRWASDRQKPRSTPLRASTGSCARAEISDVVYGHAREIFVSAVQFAPRSQETHSPTRCLQTIGGGAAELANHLTLSGRIRKCRCGAFPAPAHNRLARIHNVVIIVRVAFERQQSTPVLVSRATTRLYVSALRKSCHF